MGSKKGSKDKQTQSPSNSGDRPSPASRPSVMGVDVRDIGAAIATAVVAEIAQVAINRTLRATHASERVAESSEYVGASAQQQASSMQQVLEEAKPSVQDTVDTFKDLIEDVTPAIVKVVETVRELPGDARSSVGRVVDLAKGVAGDATQSLRHRAAETLDAVTEAIDDGRLPAANPLSSRKTALNGLYPKTSPGQTAKKRSKKKKHKRKK